MATMREVAARAGVSAKTVSRVMRQDRYVSDDVRQRVDRAITELQYVPNTLARTFRQGRDAAIGVAVPDISDPFFAGVTHAVEQVARTRDVAVFVTSLGTDGANERAGVEALLARQLTGLISTPVAADQSYLRRWQASTPMVFIDRRPRGLHADSVVQDDHGGAHAAVAHLIDHGHRRIAFIGDQLGIPTIQRRLEGYRAALTDSGLPTDPWLVRLTGSTEERVAHEVHDLFDGRRAPTAVFCADINTTVALVPVLQSLARPDIALISFGDFPLAASLRPSLTVVDQDPAAIGRFAASRVFDRHDRPDRQLRRSTVLPVDLVVRQSCAAAGTGHEPAARVLTPASKSVAPRVTRLARQA
jgi:LacI family transcriptional regulator